jgi:hypothetical protein
VAGHRPADQTPDHPADPQPRRTLAARSPGKRTTPCAPARQRRRNRQPGRSLQHHAVAHRSPRAAAQARPRRFQAAYDQAQGLAEETRHTNRKLELEVQVRSKIEKNSPASRTTSTASSTPCPRH